MRNLMKPNPILASSIYQLPGTRCIRMVLLPQVIESIRPFFDGICRICTRTETVAYEQKAYDGYNFYAWAEERLMFEDVARSGHLIYELRRRDFDASNFSFVVSMDELKREERGARTSNHPTGPGIMECVLRSPDPIPSERMFDIGRLADLPPEGYPLSGTPLEAIRNRLVKRDPGSRARQWAGHQQGIYLRELAEERLANRVLNNEQKFNFDKLRCWF